MTNEELLEEAKRRYPIDTVFKSPENGNIYTVKSYENCIENAWISEHYLIVHVKESSSTGEYLYKDGEWAEIVSKPEPQYEVGKWYKVLNRDYNGYSYTKFLRTDSKYFYFSEYIGNGKHNIYSGSWRGTDEYTLLTDLSEIQQYLPDGHPDKFNTNIPLIKDGIYVAEFLDEKYKSYSSIFICLETNTYNMRDRLYLSKDQFDKGEQGTWAVNSYNIRFRNPTTQELERYFRFINIPPGYLASLKEELNNNLKTNNNEKTTTRNTTSVKVQRLNIKIGTANPVRGNGLDCTRSKIQLGSNYSYNQKRFSSCKSRVS